MNHTLLTGSAVVTMALIAYSIAIWTEQKSKWLSKKVLFFLSLGIAFDIMATIFMIAGSTNSPFTAHGFLGYSALLVMFIDTILVWKLYLTHGFEQVSGKLHLYSRFAYTWWVIVYFTGGIIAIVL